MFQKQKAQMNVFTYNCTLVPYKRMGKHAPLHKIPLTTFDSEIEQIVFEYKFLF